MYRVSKKGACPENVLQRIAECITEDESNSILSNMFS